MSELEKWLALTLEEPIEPDLPICDAHHHLWDFRKGPVPRYAVQIKSYLPEDFLQDIEGGHNIVQTVFVECATNYRSEGPSGMKPVGETEFAKGVASQVANGRYGQPQVAAGIVGFADLCLGAAVSPVLEAHISAGDGRFRGIRYRSNWDESSEISSSTKKPKALSDPKFREGFAYLAKYHLSFDALLYHPQLMDLGDLAENFPATDIILNHIGVPLGIGPYFDRRGEVFKDWKRGMKRLAACPKVFVKLGGLGQRFCGFGWHRREIPPGSAELAEAIAPYYLYCIEQFGVSRCMFESNFPADKLSYSYNVIWNAFKRITADFKAEDKAALFHDNAAKLYRLRGRVSGKEETDNI